MTKTFWLSFCDSESGKNLGICVVQVTSEQAEEAVAIQQRINPPAGTKRASKWTLAAIGESLMMECNPGGDLQVTEIVDPSSLPPGLPRNRLVTLDELNRNGWV